MIPIAIKATKEINSFVYVPIPSAKDLFNRYGARLGSQGSYNTSQEDILDLPLPCSSGSTIDDCINAQRLAEYEFSKH